jgi:hypothetical protein
MRYACLEMKICDEKSTETFALAIILDGNSPICFPNHMIPRAVAQIIASAQQGVKWSLREYHELMHRCSEAVDKMA